jgi:predicted Rossmann fold flavoprotein
MWDVIVIGGGAAGCLAAGMVGKRGRKVLLLEKNDRVCRKLMITGKGRCNFTNNSDVQNHINNCPVNGKFITNALYRFPPDDTIRFFEELGVKSKTERGDRVFPESDNAGDIVDALKKFMQENGVEIRYESVENLAELREKFVVLCRNGEKFESSSLIIATGGKSYPRTGSTGDGYRFAEKFGHKINMLKPSLVPVETVEAWVPEMQGVALKNVAIKLYNKNDKVIYSDFGEMLFTHFGVSGPVILSATSHIRDIKNIRMEIDLKPALEHKVLDNRILREIGENPNKQYKNLLGHLMPRKMIDVFIKLTEIDGDRAAHSIRKSERQKIVEVLKGISITLKGFRPISEAIITSGGICVNEIEPRTMQSQLKKGLYFAGEIIDVDAYTGGYNLQIAFSTGYLAGENA